MTRRRTLCRTLVLVLIAVCMVCVDVGRTSTLSNDGGGMWLNSKNIMNRNSRADFSGRNRLLHSNMRFSAGARRVRNNMRLPYFGGKVL